MESEITFKIMKLRMKSEIMSEIMKSWMKFEITGEIRNHGEIEISYARSAHVGLLDIHVCTQGNNVLCTHSSHLK